MVKKGIYFDGHERTDVIEYRQNVFLPAMDIHEKYFTIYEGTDMEEQIEPALNFGEKQKLLFVHDECIYYSYEKRSTAWIREGEQPMRQKGRGRSLHVSGFLSETVGPLDLDYLPSGRNLGCR